MQHRSYALLAIMMVFSTNASARIIPQNGSDQQLLKSKAPDRFLVVLDAGHGGHDHGATQKLGPFSISEKDLTLAVTKLVAAKLRKQNVPVILTRADDEAVSLDMRAAIANRARASVLVSLHANSSPNRHDTGIETYVLNTTTNEASSRLATIENGRKNKVSPLALILSDLETSANYEESVELACQLQTNMTRKLKLAGSPVKNRGVRSALFYLLMQTHMPSVLVEMGFTSNPGELKKLTTLKYQDKLADSIVHGILNYRDRSTKDCQQLAVR